MERQKHRIDNLIIPIIYLYFITGIFWHLFPLTKPVVIKITPYGLILFPIIIFYYESLKFDLRTILWLFLIFILTMTFEIIGVKTGLIFGSYYYNNILGLKLLGVPFIIGVNWMMIIYGLFSFSQSNVKRNILLQSILVAFLSLLFDLLLEPAARKLNYWQWNTSSVPLQNYISWFAISFLFSLAGLIFKPKKCSNLIFHYLIAQTIFFTALNIFLN